MNEDRPYPEMMPDDLPAVLEAITDAWSNPRLRERIGNGVRLAFLNAGRWPDPMMTSLQVVEGGAR